MARIKEHVVLDSLKSTPTELPYVSFLFVKDLRLRFMELFHFFEKVGDYSSVLLEVFLDLS